MAQPDPTLAALSEVKTPKKAIPLAEDFKSYGENERPDVSVERYFRCRVLAHENEPSWIFVHDNLHTPLRFHMDVELILPEWAIVGLKAAKFTQMVARFGTFQKTVPYYPKHTRRFTPEIIEEVTYAEYVKWRDSDANRELPKPGDAGSNYNVG